MLVLCRCFVRYCSSLVLVCASVAAADEPDLAYVFPAGLQRGTSAEVRVGGLNLHDGCGFQVVGAGVTASDKIHPTKTIWFEGPLLELSDSQRAEDYPQDYLAKIEIAADAPLGARYCRVWTSQGATASIPFIVGDLPEIVEQEFDGEAAPVPVTLPLTINGRIFPREDIDLWSFEAREGAKIRAAVRAATLGSPPDPRRREAKFEARLTIEDSRGRVLAEAWGDSGEDPQVEFTAPATGRYQVRIHDISFGGLQNYVYRLTLAPAAPRIESVYPLGGRRGSTTRFELAGAGIAPAPLEVQLPSDRAEWYSHRFALPGGASEPVLIALDDLEEVLENEPNDTAAAPLAFESGLVINGRIDRPGDQDSFAIEVKKNEVWSFEIWAARLGSPLDSVLTVLDADGKELTRHDDIGRDQTDSQISFTARQDGPVTLRVEDRLASRGGPALAYRLKVARTLSDFELRLASDVVTLGRGKKFKLRVDLLAAAPPDSPITLSVDNLPEGVTADETVIKPKSRSAEIVLTASETARIGVTHLKVRGTAELPSGKLTRDAVFAPRRGEAVSDDLLLAVAIATPFKVVGEFAQPSIPRGSVLHRKYSIERNGFEGPIEIRLADREARHRQGVTGPTIIVPAGATEFEYPLYLPPWMLLGRTSRTCVMATGLVTDIDGTQHYVTYSSLHQNDQMIARVSAALLGVGLEQESLIVRPGETASLGVRLQRSGETPGPVRIELVVPPHVQGISALPLVVPAGATEGTLQLSFAAHCGPFNVPLVVRGTFDSPSGPIVGESKLELVGPRNVADAGRAR